MRVADCKLEFDYALKRKGVYNLIPVVMEKAKKDQSTWHGPVGGRLGNSIYVDLSMDHPFPKDKLGEIADLIAVRKARQKNESFVKEKREEAFASRAADDVPEVPERTSAPSRLVLEKQLSAPSRALAREVAGVAPLQV